MAEVVEMDGRARPANDRLARLAGEGPSVYYLAVAWHREEDIGKRTPGRGHREEAAEREEKAGRKTYFLLHEVAELTLIFDLDQLLAAIGRVGDVQLHLGGGCWRSTWADVG